MFWIVWRYALSLVACVIVLGTVVPQWYNSGSDAKVKAAFLLAFIMVTTMAILVRGLVREVRKEGEKE